ncbi:MAG: polysaccharide biosynthesis/export family protein [Planctomycetes bacterium]|nr:polysaccharide biosynthesis/export family protein [Planctomycetota bacterium]
MLAGVLTAALAGCSDDNRITMDALHELESQISREMQERSVKELAPEQVALTEIRAETVGPGDVLTLTITGANGPYLVNNVRVRVNENGQIRLPLVGTLKVGGLDMNGVEQVVIDAHVPDFVKDLTVFAELTLPEATTVLVVNAGGQPELVTLRSNERNVLYALALSARATQGASGRVTVRSVRPEREAVVYNLTQADGARRALLAPPLESGDTVFVEAAPTYSVFLTGLVNAPGPLALPPDSSISVARAIASAGGLIDFLDPQEATLWRELPDGEQVRVKVNIADILAGKSPDFDLHVGDILDVPHTAETRFRDWILQNIRIGPFSVGGHYDVVSQFNFRRALNDNNRSFGQSALDNVLFSLPNAIVPPVLPPAATPN